MPASTHMREEEGRSTERELRQRMAHVQTARAEIEKHRRAILHIYTDKLNARHAGADRIASGTGAPAAGGGPAGRPQRHSGRTGPPDAHVQHFLGLLDQGGEVGKKLDFLLQEMNREANTLLSKTSGLAGDALKITESGLSMKVGNRKGPGTGAKPRMTTVFIISAPSGSGKSTLVDNVRSDRSRT